jgi:hypothetical protein
MLSGLTSQKSFFVDHFNSETELNENEKTEKAKNYNFIEIQKDIKDFSVDSLPETESTHKIEKNQFSRIHLSE